MDIELDEEERQYLIDLLETALGDARVEARHTQTTEYRRRVRHQQDVVRGILQRLDSAQASPA